MSLAEEEAKLAVFIDFSTYCLSSLNSDYPFPLLESIGLDFYQPFPAWMFWSIIFRLQMFRIYGEYGNVNQCHLESARMEKTR